MHESMYWMLISSPFEMGRTASKMTLNVFGSHVQWAFGEQLYTVRWFNIPKIDEHTYDYIGSDLRTQHSDPQCHWSQVVALQRRWSA